MIQDASGKIGDSKLEEVDAPPGASPEKVARKAPSKNKKKVLKRSREMRQRREARSYPGKTLEECVKVVEAIKTQNAGNPWPPDEVAKAIKIKSRSSNLAEIIRSANLYGIVYGTYRATTVSLTELGRKLAYPHNDDELNRARQEALFSVDLFKRVVLHYRDSALPESPFINNTLTREFALSTDFHEEFLKILRKNLEYVGKTNTPRLSSPSEPTLRGKSSVAVSEKATLRAFVIMPLVERHSGNRSEGFFKEVNLSIIRPACEKASFEAVTADRKGSDIIHTTILREILEADIVIADLTDHNPNVMFELGLRMAMAKKPISIIKTKDTGRIFDVDNVLRVYEYNQNLWQSTVQNDIPELAAHISASWEARNTGAGYVEILTGRSGA